MNDSSMPLSNYGDWESCSQTEGSTAGRTQDNNTGAAQSDTCLGSITGTQAEQEGRFSPGDKGLLRQHLEAPSQNSHNSKRWQSDQMRFKM